MWDIVLLSVFVMYDDLLHIKYLLLILSLLEVLLSKGDFEISCWMAAKRKKKKEKVNYMQRLSVVVKTCIFSTWKSRYCFLL